MTSGERDWIDWRAAGSPDGERPDVPQTIPERWWPDNEFVVERVNSASAQSASETKER
jgi:hypothetical protein